MTQLRIGERLARIERALEQIDPRRLHLADRIRAARARCPGTDFDAPPTQEEFERGCRLVEALGLPTPPPPPAFREWCELPPSWWPRPAPSVDGSKDSQEANPHDAVRLASPAAPASATQSAGEEPEDPISPTSLPAGSTHLEPKA